MIIGIKKFHSFVCCILVFISNKLLKHEDQCYDHLFRHSKYWLPWLVGMPAETATAICSLLMGGVLKRFPRLKVTCHNDHKAPLFLILWLVTQCC